MELTALEATDADFFGTYEDDTTPGLLNSLPDNIESVSDDESSFATNAEDSNMLCWEVHLGNVNDLEWMQTSKSVDIPEDPSDSPKYGQIRLLRFKPNIHNLSYVAYLD
jgi:hypothetical protein